MRVLHVPFTYFPDTAGGTEVYVRGLARELGALGFPSSIAAPGTMTAGYEHDGLTVHRFAVGTSDPLGRAYGVPDTVAADGFRAIMARVRPDVVHLHARTAAVSERLLQIAHEYGAKAVFTYHTPTVSCPRGTLMLHGRTACDGVVSYRRCVSCALEGRAVSQRFAQAAAAVPEALATAVSGCTWLAGPLAPARVPGLIANQRHRFHGLMSEADHIVAVCNWVRELLVANGVPPDKLTLSRQGISFVAPIRSLRPPATLPLRLAYFGRTDPSKGPDLLGEALKLIPDAKVQIDLYPLLQSRPDRAFERLCLQCDADPRLRMCAAVPPDRTQETMAQYHMICVPSRWLETGPLVALEAFAAGVPVLGAAHGGIAELVRDGVNGVLAKPDDVVDWASTIQGLAAAPERVDELRRGLRPIRTMLDCAHDMAEIYSRLGDCGRLDPSSAARPAA